MKLGGRLSNRRDRLAQHAISGDRLCEKALCKVPSLCKEAVMTGINAH